MVEKKIIIGSKNFDLPEDIEKDTTNILPTIFSDVKSIPYANDLVYRGYHDTKKVFSFLNTTKVIPRHYIYFSKNDIFPDPNVIKENGFEWEELAKLYASYAVPYDSFYRIPSAFSLSVYSQSPEGWMKDILYGKENYTKKPFPPFPKFTKLDSFKSEIEERENISKNPMFKYAFEDEPSLKYSEYFTNVKLRLMSWYAFWYGGFKFNPIKENAYIILSVDGNSLTGSTNKIDVIPDNSNGLKEDIYTVQYDTSSTLGDPETIKRIVLNVGFRSFDDLPLPPSVANIELYLYNGRIKKWEFVDTFKKCYSIIFIKTPDKLKWLRENNPEQLKRMGFKVVNGKIMFRQISLNNNFFIPIIYIDDFSDFISVNGLEKSRGLEVINWAKDLYLASIGEKNYADIKRLNIPTSNNFMVGFHVQKPTNFLENSQDIRYICADHRTSMSIIPEQIEQLNSGVTGDLIYEGFEIIDLFTGAATDTMNELLPIDIIPDELYNIDADTTIFGANSKVRDSCKYLKDIMIPQTEEINVNLNNLKESIEKQIEILWADIKEIVDILLDSDKSLDSGLGESLSAILGLIKGILNTGLGLIVKGIDALVGIAVWIGQEIGQLLELAAPFVPLLVTFLPALGELVGGLFTATGVGAVVGVIISLIFGLLTGIGNILGESGTKSLGALISLISEGIGVIPSFISMLWDNLSKVLDSVDAGASLGGLFGKIGSTVVKCFKAFIYIVKMMIIDIPKMLLNVFENFVYVFLSGVSYTISVFKYYLVTGDGWVTPFASYIMYDRIYDYEKPFPYFETPVIDVSKEAGVDTTLMLDSLKIPCPYYEGMTEKDIVKLLGEKRFKGKIFVRASPNLFDPRTPEDILPFREVYYEDNLVIKGEYPYIEYEYDISTVDSYVVGKYFQFKIEFGVNSVPTIAFFLFKNKKIPVELTTYKNMEVVLSDSNVKFGVNENASVTASFSIPEEKAGESVPVELSFSVVEIKSDVSTVETNFSVCYYNDQEPSEVYFEVLTPKGEGSVESKFDVVYYGSQSLLVEELGVIQYKESSVPVSFIGGDYGYGEVNTEFGVIKVGENEIDLSFTVYLFAQSDVPVSIYVLKEEESGTELNFNVIKEMYLEDKVMAEIGVYLRWDDLEALSVTWVVK